jgi:hypothetical protein
MCEEVVVVTTRQQPAGSPDPDDDPTGIRALLGSLPEPGPMPEQLVARITASIAAEQSHRSTVRPLSHRRRPLWRTAGLAAAAAAVIGIGGASLLTSTSPGDLAALVSGSGSDSAPSSGGSAVREGAAEDTPRDTSGPGAYSTTVVSVHHSARAYSAAAFAGQAQRLLSSPGAALAPSAPESPGIGPIGTQQGVLSCLSALTTEPFAQVTADLGTFDGTPAAVLVLTTDTGHTAYAVRRSCTAAQPALLAGPTPLP